MCFRSRRRPTGCRCSGIRRSRCRVDLSRAQSSREVRPGRGCQSSRAANRAAPAERAPRRRARLPARRDSIRPPSVQPKYSLGVTPGRRAPRARSGRNAVRALGTSRERSLPTRPRKQGSKGVTQWPRGVLQHVRPEVAAICVALVSLLRSRDLPPPLPTRAGGHRLLHLRRGGGVRPREHCCLASHRNGLLLPCATDGAIARCERLGPARAMG